jgi:CRP/FNR family cyclic AMP-dependent transcriptional regulator
MPMSALDRFEPLQPLGTDVLRKLESRCTFVQCEANELIIDYDDASADVYFVISGQVRVIYRSATGKEVILGEIVSGQFFGELAAIDGQPRSANVTALHRSRLCIMPRTVFVDLIDQAPAFNRHVMRLLTSRIRSLNARLAEHAFLQARQRLYAELLRLSASRAERHAERVISPPPLQHDIANRIGSRREVVSRELARLTRAGMIERTRGALVLKKPGELNRRISTALDEASK